MFEKEIMCAFFSVVISGYDIEVIWKMIFLVIKILDDNEQKI